LPKLATNKQRDRRNDRDLRKLGWKVITVWECQLASKVKLARQVARITRLLAQV
jgi:DNA mismatch endonuclease (patch repair protein)